MVHAALEMKRACLAGLLAFSIAGISESAAAAFSAFTTDLESDDVACWASLPSEGCLGWLGIRDAGIILLGGGVSHSGSKALRMTFSANEDYGGAYRSVGTAGGRHVFTRFYDYYSEGFDFAAGMKIHRLSAFNQATQKNDFDIILQLKADSPSADYCGTTDASWLALSFNGGPVDWGSVEGHFSPQRGRWYCVETEVKLNTPGKSDGEIRIYIDGKLFVEKKGMNLTAGVATPINSVMFGGWYSNSAAGRNPCPNPSKPSTRYVDDPAIATAYIGPMPSVSVGTLATARLLSIRLPWGGSLEAEYGATAAYGKVSAKVRSADGTFAIPLTGLTAGQAFHYRLRGLLSNGLAYASPGYGYPGAASVPAPVPAPKHGPPRNLPSHNYDPIPD